MRLCDHVHYIYISYIYIKRGWEGKKHEGKKTSRHECLTTADNWERTAGKGQPNPKDKTILSTVPA